MLRLNIDKLQDFLKELEEEYQVYLPINKEQQTEFYSFSKLLNSDKNLEIDFNSRLSVKSPKNFFFPRSESYLEFTKDNGRLDFKLKELTGKPNLIFGIRNCDQESFKLLDKVFLQEPVDQLYQRRRESTITVVERCLEQSETCFCQLFDIEPAASETGADLYYFYSNNNLYFTAESDQGELLLSEYSHFFKSTETGKEAELKMKAKKFNETVSTKSNNTLTKYDPELLYENKEAIFNSNIWQELANRCLECGICTYLCPTCHCYDIQDYAADQAGERYRCWDSCLFSNFTEMAHGDNPREETYQRLRQRFFHKLVYFPEEQEESLACVGCGRCLGNCPVNIDITEVLALAGGVING
ncbi:MAG: 4Fe-4S dicluster domain-containing protein [Bacillota bacterium]